MLPLLPLQTRVGTAVGVQLDVTYLCNQQGNCAALASCLINAQPLPAQTTAPLLAAQGHDLIDGWPLPSAHFVDS